MQIIRYILASFSMFSAVPVKKELCSSDFKFAPVFLPLVGFTLGALNFAVIVIFELFKINDIIKALFMCLLPVIFTGGIHLDGFMDCHDAFASHSGKERMLEIMKDSSIGAFACLYMIIYELSFFVLCFTLPKTIENLIFLIFLFSLSRIMSAYALLTLPNARTFGMGKALKDASDNRKSSHILLFESIIILILAFTVNVKSALWLFAFAFISFIYCTGKMKRMFDGITGDLAGWMLSSCELMMLLGLNIASGGIF